MKPKPRNPTDEELKAAFIAKNGVKRIEPVKVPLPPPVLEKAPPKPAPKIIEPINLDPGLKPMLTWLPIGQLHANEAYQRPTTTTRGQRVIRDIVENFQWKLFSIVTVTRREEGGYWLIDGQHRTIGAKLRGIDKVPAIVIPDLTPEEQARTFAGINGKRVSVNPYAIHHAMLAAGDETAQRIARVCERAGVKIPRYPKSATQGLLPDETMALAAIKEGIKRHGEDLVAGVLTSIRKAYPTTPGKLNRDDIKARMAKAAYRREFGEETA